MKLGRKLRICLTLYTLISFPALLYAQDAMEDTDRGRYAQVLEGETSPFNGWCFDNKAAGEIFSALKHSKEQCQLQIDLSLKKQSAEYDLEVGNLKLRIGTMEEEHKEILKIKNIEIEELSAAALKRPNDYVAWWAAGGFVAGALTVVSIFLLVN